MLRGARLGLVFLWMCAVPNEPKTLLPGEHIGTDSVSSGFLDLVSTKRKAGPKTVSGKDQAGESKRTIDGGVENKRTTSNGSFTPPGRIQGKLCTAWTASDIQAA